MISYRYGVADSIPRVDRHCEDTFACIGCAAAAQERCWPTNDSHAHCDDKSNRRPDDLAVARIIFCSALNTKWDRYEVAHGEGWLEERDGNKTSSYWTEYEYVVYQYAESSNNGTTLRICRTKVG